MKNNKRILSRNISFFSLTIWIIMLIWSFILLYMLGWGIITSIKDSIYYWFDPVGIPLKKEQINLMNYLQCFKTMKIYISKSDSWAFFPQMLLNSLFYVIVYGFLNVFSPMLCSYISAKYSKKIRWTKILWVIVLINLYVPLSASLAASINFTMQIGIYDNIFAYLTIALNGFSGNFLIYYAIWKGLSWEYAEAAFMDGASNTQVLFKIMLPMTLTIFGVLFITQAITLWSDYSTPMVFLPSYPTLAYGVFRFQNTAEYDSASVPVKLAGLIAVAVPVFVLFMAFKDKIMTSLTIGGLKG